jgi:uncharacterized membrane protein YebE (DUF533 family)
MALTDEQRKWLGTAIAMAMADGVLDPSEKKLLGQICDELELSDEARAEVAQMLREPPSPVELAAWAISAEDRVGLYRLAARTADADGHLAKPEEGLLKVLASVLDLTDEEMAGG